MNEILIVDDDRDFAESLADLLEIQGHSFAIADNGRSAVELARERRFDLAFLDIKMPGIDGVETLRRLHKVQDHLKVVIVTGYATSDQLDDAVLAGAFTVLEKPCSIETLLDMANRAGCEQLILIADDDPDFAETLDEMLSTSGRRVLTADRGLAVLDRLEDDPVSLLLLDLRLPELDGYEILAALRRRDTTVPVIVVTAYSAVAEDLKALNPAVREVLPKPIGPRRLVEAIDRAIGFKSVDGKGGIP